MEESLDIVKLSKLFNNMYKPKVDVEFSEDEVNDFNEHIRNNNIDSIVHLFESKENMGIDNLKDIIHSKFDSLWQYIMDQSYERWNHNGMSREEFLNQLTDYEKIAVMFGNFNYQVENGGLYQWHENGYSEDFDSLYEFLDNSDYNKKENFLLLLDNFMDIKNAVEKLDRYDDWYEEDYQTRMNALNTYDSDYYRIQKSWDEYFENYLIVNIPDEYKQKIIDLKEDINI